MNPSLALLRTLRDLIYETGAATGTIMGTITVPKDNDPFGWRG